LPPSTRKSLTKQWRNILLQVCVEAQSSEGIIV
jgi:hypothetical protein